MQTQGTEEERKELLTPCGVMAKLLSVVTPHLSLGELALVSQVSSLPEVPASASSRVRSLAAWQS